MPAQAIILTGSRATGQGLAPDSDYDLVAVMDTIQVPFYLNKLKRLEANLSRELGVEVSLNPLPKFRLRRAKGNLYLFKLKHEGVTLWGRDFISTLEPGDAHDIRPRWHFSYLFTAMKHLGQDFEPDYLLGDSAPPHKLGREAAKAILYCAEVLALRQGYYSSQPEALASWLSQRHSLSPSFTSDLEAALAWRSGREGTASQALALWLSAKDYLAEAFRHLMGGDEKDGAPNISNLSRQYLIRGLWPKNWQYFVLTLLLRRQLWWRALLDTRSIEHRVQMALLHLLCSVTSDGKLVRSYLEQAHRLLAGRASLSHPGDDLSLWQQLKGAIYASWPYACPVLGM